MKLARPQNRLLLPFGASAKPTYSRQRVTSSSPIRCQASKDAELKQMEEFKANLAKSLESASKPGSASPSSTSTTNKSNTSTEDNGTDRDLIEVTLDQYWPAVDSLSANGQILVMDFYTQWCGPCKLIKPTLCDWSEELAGKVNFRKFECSKENAPVGKEVQVKSVPTFIVYKNNQEVGRVVGKQEAKLRSLIEEHMIGA